MNKVPVVFGTDKEYIFPTMVTIESLLENAAKDTFYHIYLQTDIHSKELCSDYEKKLRQKFRNFEIQYLIMKPEDFSGLVCNNKHVSFPTYYRLVVANQLSELEKCICLDSDLLIVDDLYSLFMLELEDDYIAGVPSWDDQQENEYNYWHMQNNLLSDMSSYIYLGVTVLNLKKIREDNMVEKFCAAMQRGYRSDDQDVFNVCCYNHIKRIPLRYNLLVRFYGEEFPDGKQIYTKEEIREANERPAILHYPGALIKPWKNILVKKSAQWWKCADLFRDTPQFKICQEELRTFLKQNMIESFLMTVKGVTLLIIYGYSENGLEIKRELRSGGYIGDIVFCDGDVTKWGQTNDGDIVMSFDALARAYTTHNLYYIVSSQNYRDDIIRVLTNHGVDRNHIFAFQARDWRFFRSLDKQRWMSWQESRQRFYVWGAGKRGSDVINVLGEDRVVAFIERNPQKVGALYRNKKVISLDEFIAKYDGEYIIVTPEGYEDELVQMLFDKNIFRVFKYGEDFLDVETYMLQVNKEKLFADIKIQQKQFVYGFSLLGLLLYEDLQALGCECSFVLQTGLEPHALSKKYRVCTVEEANLLHLAMPIEMDFYNGAVCEYYNLIDRYDFHNEALDYFRNKNVGQRCFIVATGPSLRIEDLDTLYEHHEICISMNGIFKSFDLTKWRPDYYMVSDPNAMFFNKEVFENMDVRYKFAADTIGDIGKRTDNTYRWHLVRRWKKGEAPKFSSDFSKGSYAGLTVTYDGALQLAAFLGFSEIYLLGVDCNNYRECGTSHFFDKFGKEKKAETGFLDIEQNILAFQSAKKYADEHGICIYNATRGGNLEVFERVNFDRLFD